MNDPLKNRKKTELQQKIMPTLVATQWKPPPLVITACVMSVRKR